jgi:hypothetical protein
MQVVRHSPYASATLFKFSSLGSSGSFVVIELTAVELFFGFK